MKLTDTVKAVLKEPDEPVRFQTVHGIGYKFVGCEAQHPALTDRM
jgi:DNA-binding winged helix-turn-helix (wHTH) protein